MDSARKQRSARKLTAKGLRTRAELLECARNAFEEYGYYATSVSEIGRRCGVSQGTFYQYFNNKEQIFREMIDGVLANFWRRVSGQPDAQDDFPAQLRTVVAALLEHCRQNAATHRILNEFELIDIITIGYYESLARYLRDFFRQATNQGQMRYLDPNVVSYSLIGICIFHAMEWGPDSPDFSSQDLADYTAQLLLSGISGPKKWEPPARLGVSDFPEDPEGPLAWSEAGAQSNRTRRAIFQASEQVMGECGFHGASISDITRRAGVAQGTFYTHFQSKQELMQGVVRYLSRELRWNLKQATERVQDRRDQEKEGLLAFFRFLKPHSQIYRVVAECETIGREMALWYYRKLAAGYAESLLPGMEKGEICSLPVQFLAHSLMGINHMLGLKWLVWNSAPNAEVPEQTIEDTLELILFGLDSSL